MEIVGVVSIITFRNEDNGYSVARLNSGIIAVGCMPFVAFIGGGLIFGVGPVTAKKIVKKFGCGTLAVLAETPEKLAEIRGITRAKAERIGQGYKEIQAMQDTVMYFCRFEISLNMAIRIYKHYGETAVAVVSRNPYALIETIDGIGFLTADKMAKTLGVSHNSTFRVRAGIVYCLGQSAEVDGNTYLPLLALSKAVCQLLALLVPGTFFATNS